LKILRSPVVFFLLIGLVTAVAILVGSNHLADRAASDEAISEAERTTQLLAQSVIGPEMPRGLVNLRPENVDQYTGLLDQFDVEVKKRLVDVDRPFRINLWSRDGRLIYTSELEIIIKNIRSLDLKLDRDQRRILHDGGVDSEIADPSRPEDEHNLADVGTDGMVRIYARAESPEGKPILVETYFTLDELGQRRAEIFSSFRWITLGGLGLLTLVATIILIGLTRQLRSAAAERERLLHSSLDASDAERRRIARDLHDSVVQDLAGTAFSVSAVARTPDLSEESRETLDAAGASLRTSLKSLRSLLAEIHPPELSADGLPAALADLIAPAAAQDMQASVSVEGAETASDEHVALVWRVAQEAARNAMRHSKASTLAVTVRGDGRTLTLEVVDDGVGFDPARTAPDSYGLRGLRSLVADNGGVLQVRSSPGEGTTVRMEVDAQ
jgi:signal transduction histidine kinase